MTRDQAVQMAGRIPLGTWLIVHVSDAENLEAIVGRFAGLKMRGGRDILVLRDGEFRKGRVDGTLEPAAGRRVDEVPLDDVQVLGVQLDG